jgi:hypothetical protein
MNWAECEARSPQSPFDQLLGELGFSGVRSERRWSATSENGAVRGMAQAVSLSWYGWSELDGGKSAREDENRGKT